VTLQLSIALASTGKCCNMSQPGALIDKQFCFLSGLPRAGSTLLSALLNDHPAIHASTNSPLLELIHYTEGYLFKRSEQYEANPKPESARRVISSIAPNYYFDITEPVIVDKSRGWVNQIKHITDYVTDTPRIICPVRDIADIVVSFLALIEKSGSDNYIDERLREKGLTPSAETRFQFLMDTRGTVGHAYLTLRDAFRNGWDKYVLLVEYEELIANTQAVMDRIYRFIGVDSHSHVFDNIQPKFAEDDSVYGLRDMHHVRPAIAKIEREAADHLPRELIQKCHGLEFWRR
jgi:sulfotransferase